MLFSCLWSCTLKLTWHKSFNFVSFSASFKSCGFFDVWVNKSSYFPSQEFWPHLCLLALCIFTSWVMSCECLVAYPDIVMHLSKIANSVWRWMTICFGCLLLWSSNVFCSVSAKDVLALFKAITSPWQWTNLI